MNTPNALTQPDPAAPAPERADTPYRCPICRQPLMVSASPSGLRCLQHGLFPLVDGILSFMPAWDRAFDRHWEGNRDASPAPAKERAARRFLTPLRTEAGGPPLRVLDAGCGDGVHVAVLKDQGWQIFGLDIAPAALTNARRRVGDGWTPIHGDVSALPFADATFDAAFSFGVLAYTPDPWAGLAELVRVTRPGGWIGVWFYPRRNDLPGRLLAAVRSVVVRLPPFLQARAADLIVPFLSVLPTISGVSLANATWRQCREVVLVNIAPDTLAFFSPAEVEARMIGSGLVAITRDEGAPITLWGRVPDARPDDKAEESPAAEPE
ncbi:class I SAM-dependent methyltransferase [Azospirillum isscasi]|uniref:Class I SAM-dependent methyltransferase n=1 Tax=Azospirillum isscasi TaxID=3053926 RepID=A0ABU0WM87_9PROT|nr:class I SAM-dependent methyltransferase [Azospirillum isscasi]MDQ2105342.1 class I SAM-dependent methyltransferase [Azospirillum isscasi]